MCGIAFSYDLRRRGRATPWARPLMEHRGPDGNGALRLDEWELTLEHTRLAIIDPDNRDADQPFADPSGRWLIVYNGEIFNFRELRTELQREGSRFRTACDTEVVLEGFIRQGEAFFARLHGMFAFAIVDTQTGELVAARDQIGVKPLYWYFGQGLLVAASELRTVVGHPHVAPRLDAVAVVEYLAFGHTSGDRTLVDGVRKLAPGELLRLRDGEIERAAFWDALDGAGRREGPGLEAELLERLDAAVAASLVSDVPVSLMLSGGLDSSAIAALATRHVPGRDLTAYSVSFGLPNDEAAVAARLAGELGIRHREILLTKESIADGFDEWLRAMDVPSANPTWIAVSHIAEAVRDAGGKVLLAGDGGDELFGGYRRWMKYLRFHDLVWGRTPAPVRRSAGALARPLTRGLSHDIARRARDGKELFVGSRPFHDDDLAACLGPRGLEAATTEPPELPVERLRATYEDRTNGNGDYLGWMSYLALNKSLVEDFLARLDKMGMAKSVEGRVPLLDPTLAEWTLGVTQQRKVPGYEQKALFRAAVRPVLPNYIIERPKQGFCAPVGEWASSLLTERLDEDSLLVEEGIVAAGAVRYLKSRPPAKASFALWSLGTLQAWCAENI